MTRTFANCLPNYPERVENSVIRIQEGKEEAIHKVLAHVLCQQCKLLYFDLLNDRDGESPSSLQSVEPPEGSEKKKESGALQKALQLLSNPQTGPLTDEQFEAIQWAKDKKRHYGKHFRIMLDAILHKFSRFPALTWAEVGSKYGDFPVRRAKDRYSKWKKDGFFARIERVLSKPELTNLINYQKKLTNQNQNQESVLPIEDQILTDEQWKVIEPFVLTVNQSHYSNRDCFNAILHKNTSKKLVWTAVKKKLGRESKKLGQRIIIQQSVWAFDGKFDEILKELMEKNLFPDLQQRLRIVIKKKLKKIKKNDE